MASVKRIFTKLAGLKVRDIVYRNIYEGFELPHEDNTVWVWSKTTLWRYLKEILLVYEDKISRYGHTKQEQIFSR